MFEKDSERSSDLEWRLTSRQEDQEALVKFLVEEQFERVFRLCLLVWEDPVTARQAALQALATAAGNAYQFTGQTSAQAWLYRITLEICRSLHSPQVNKVILARYLRQKLDLPIDEISYILKVQQSRLRVEFEKTEQTGTDTGLNDQAVQQSVSLPTLTLAEEQQIEEEVLRLILHTSRHRRLSALLQEAFLLSLGLLLAVIVGRAAIGSLKAPAIPVTPSQLAVLATQEVLVYPGNRSLPGATPERQIIYFAEAGDTLTNIAKKTGTDIDTLLLLNEIPPKKPLQPGQPVVIAMVTPALSKITPTPVTPVPPMEPLSLQSSPDVIRQRILDSQQNWHTLWAEAAYIRYGPAGYIGPPEVDRQQAWISQPDYSLTLSGNPVGDVESAIQASGGIITSLDAQSGSLSRLESGILVTYTKPIHEILLPTRMRTNFNEVLTVHGEDTVAGRATLVVDWFEIDPEAKTGGNQDVRLMLNQGRFWVDRTTGVILHRQWFDPDQPDLVVKEIVVKQIAYDIPIPNRFFDPQRELPARLYQDPGGDPLPLGYYPSTDWQPASQRQSLPHQPPPADFDPAASEITFQWTNLQELKPYQSTRADVFAGGYYLGNVQFGDPRSLSCQRSPDGKRIAFTEWLEVPPYGARPMRWFNLDNIKIVNEPMPDLISGNFAFSPDSRRLALFACTRSLQSCGIYLLDLETGHYRQLVEMAFAGSLGWRPDGEQLAFRGAKKPREESSLWVVDAGSGELIYHGPLVPGSSQLAGRTPLPGWGPVLQRMGRGAEGCSQPPGN